MKETLKRDICGILSSAENKNFCVICCHGIRSDKNEHGNFTKLSDKLIENGISCYRFDFTGHGDSSKEFSEFCISAGIKDLETAIEYVEKLGFKKIVVLGASFGAGIAGLVDYLKYPKVTTLVLWYPVLVYSDADLFSKENVEKAVKDGVFVTKSIHTKKIYQFSKNLMLETLEYCPYEKILKLDIPKLLVHGRKDTVTPCGRTEDLAKKSIFSKLLVVENGTYGFFDKEEHLNKVIDDTIKYIREVLHESCVNSDGFD